MSCHPYSATWMLEEPSSDPGSYLGCLKQRASRRLMCAAAAAQRTRLAQSPSEAASHFVQHECWPPAKAFDSSSVDTFAPFQRLPAKHAPDPVKNTLIQRCIDIVFKVSSEIYLP